MTGAEALAARYGERAVQSLRDLVTHCETAARLVARGRQAYDADEMLFHAAKSIIARAGECVDRLDKAGTGLPGDHPELELRQLKDARNFVTHTYDRVDPSMVWDMLAIDLPRVATRVREILTRGDQA
ncbi:protein of unknown function DUF86 [Xylanimonas cellulosilytica DSM 15894]|uniref:DUF86 domain-containing protein n=1 Tax=Xylanimonas cellulosilytica (strain DSM 15894 / JCM 12276 / CECT 5975 / KCTC 9989 / LMG 20990 / NBRC 107835 / XIL07) TaxID=446471 RepID=D1BS66_XYLCX|nr:HepT-like ribonuclease domain-containing protein [Xylanimonas cellulosilytica]ACZ30558.1 protein of unknown function DUF86 [Xylanimonas cellulosilytica DSM 15894]